MKYLIAGGGFSGLSTAYYLAKKSLVDGVPRKIMIIQGPMPGGWAQTNKLGNAIVEGGPRSLRPVGEAGANTLELVKDLGLDSQILVVKNDNPASKNRFLFFNGSLNKLPSSISEALLSPPPVFDGVINSVLREPFKPKAKHIDETVASFFTRRFGKNVAENLASALIAGIYAGDSRELSIRSTFPSIWKMEKNDGSIVLGAIKSSFRAKKIKTENPAYQDFVDEVGRSKMYSFKFGMQTLADELLAKVQSMGVQVLPNSVSAILADDKSLTAVLDNGLNFDVDHVVGTVPAKVLAKLLPKHDQFAVVKEALSSIEAYDVAVVNLVYEGTGYDLHGFGFLVPQTQIDKINSVGIVFDSTAFPEHGEAGQTTMTAMMGGAYFKSKFGDVSTVSKDHLKDLAIVDVEKTLGIPKSKLLKYRVNIQRKCIPRYVVGHNDKVSLIKGELQRAGKGRLSITGASYDGVSVNDCILNAKILAESLP